MGAQIVGFLQLFCGVIPDRPARLLPEFLGDFHLRIDVLLHLLLVEYLLDAGFLVARAHVFVARNAADRCLGRAAGMAAVFAKA